jgi:predicted site-specific integrase-resolvase
MSNRPIYTRLFNAPETFGVSVNTIYRWADKGLLTIHRRGRASFLRTDEMIALIEAHPNPSGE